MGPSIWQLAIVLVIIILLFGTKKLRNMGGDLGSAFKSFKKAVSDDDKKSVEETTKDEGRVIDAESEPVVKKKSD